MKKARNPKGEFEAARLDRQPLDVVLEPIPGGPDARWVNKWVLESIGTPTEWIAESDAVFAEFERITADCRRPDGEIDLAKFRARCLFRFQVTDPLLRTLTLQELVALDHEWHNAEEYRVAVALRLQEAQLQASAPAVDNRAKVDAYIREIFARKGRRIRRTDFWMAAGYTDPTAFQQWQRNDPETSETAKENFERVLAEKPHLKTDLG